MRRRLLLVGGVTLAGCAAAAPMQPGGDTRGARLVAAYPDHLAAVEGDTLVWRDGARMPIGASQPARDFETMLRSATIADQLRQYYVTGPMRGAPPRDHSPGRLRNAAFFERMYGDCRRGETARHLRPVTWMPRTRPQVLLVTTVNDVATRLERVIASLEALPDRFKGYLVPAAGTFACRAVADTGMPSIHAYGAAIDVAVRQSDYWIWSRARGEIPYRNRIPFEIVEPFEAERFIWGGKWYHYDTMHFEYRPELFV
ncbi:M15 family metallopeptidase [Neoroseomonas lacus]|uniref:Peptidase M15C domain-containing protein n=1 Tax=Neoroseomonas lacus TaxID=287609 RepID=A0A917L6A0_9PROT|nr:M15 family metallopeptidase [Neoroseomonas lacus]GGJ45211.1 hypothetical protein GCM10011320_60800 [Neoroseomonas lacus]